MPKLLAERFNPAIPQQAKRSEISKDKTLFKKET